MKQLTRLRGGLPGVHHPSLLFNTSMRTNPFVINPISSTISVIQSTFCSVPTEACNTSLNRGTERKLTTEPVRSRLLSVLALASAESHSGRWPAKQLNNNTPCIDNLLIEPLCTAWNLNPKSVSRLIAFVCSAKDELLSNCKRDDSSNDPTHIRLELLNPARVLVDFFDPLSHVGVRQPQKLLADCPPLLLASSIPSSSPAHKWRGHVPKHPTALLEALDELEGLLNRKDVLTLLNNFPAVLLRPRHELTMIHNYLTEQMNLQSSELAHATQMRAHRHSLRMTSGLQLATCPAWCLPLSRVRARHLLALFAGCWPLGRLPLDVTGNKRLAKLLNGPASQVAQWLGLTTLNQDHPGNDAHQPENAITLTEADVEAFENLISQVNFDGDTDTEKQSNKVSGG